MPVLQTTTDISRRSALLYFVEANFDVGFAGNVVERHYKFRAFRLM